MHISLPENGLKSIYGRCQAVLFCILLTFHIGCEEKPIKTTELGQQQLPLNFQTSKILVPTYLGNDKRKFHGIGPVPHPLVVVWKYKIGGDSTRIGKKAVKWYGTGWTGQPTLVCEDGHDYLIIGGYDHILRKIDAESGKEIWKYTFDDVIKASSTLFEMKQDIMILQGSRQGFKNTLRDMLIPSFRAISFNTGQEIWRLNVPRTGSYSRDVDGSALIYKDKIVIGAENGMLYVLDPLETELRQGIQQPKILHEYRLYDKKDVLQHRGNVTIESSPALLDDVVYISSGAGHIYGIDLKKDSIIWDFRTGSDLDGTVTITEDKKLLCGIEKQYIKGQGGLIKLDPARSPSDCVEWFYPTGNKNFAGWEGGIIGSQSVREVPKHPMVAFHAIDGYLYVVSLNDTNNMVMGFDSTKFYPSPKLLFKKYIGGSISTPIFIDNHLITQGYNEMMYVFDINDTTMIFSQVDSLNIGSIESTPIVWQNRIYIGSRNGYFYCLGEKKASRGDTTNLMKPVLKKKLLSSKFL
jgi:outer membrane protein assembly factor BamB